MGLRYPRGMGRAGEWRDELHPVQQSQLQDALSRTASDLTSEGASSPGGDSYEERLAGLTHAAVENVPGADHVGLTMREPDGSLVAHAASDATVGVLDRLQSDLGEGPCREAVVEGATAVIHVRDFSTESRWPRFSAEAIEQGVFSLVSFAMAPRGATPGAVNFYSGTRDGFDTIAVATAGAFAMQAAVAVYGARRIANLEYALQSRDVIGQAKGILMERYGVDGADAFTRLVAASKDTNIKLVDVARWLVGDVARGRAGPDASRDTPRRGDRSEV